MSRCFCESCLGFPLGVNSLYECKCLTLDKMCKNFVLLIALVFLPSLTIAIHVTIRFIFTSINIYLYIYVYIYVHTSLHFHSWTDIASVITKVCSCNTLLLFNNLSRSIYSHQHFQKPRQKVSLQTHVLLKINKYMFRK